MQQYGMSDQLSVQLAGPFGSAGSAVKLITLLLTAQDWKGAVSPWFQTVTPEGISVNSRIDLLPDVQQLENFRQGGISLFAENENGTVTVYALGNKPGEDLTVQGAAMEVIV